MRRAIVRELGAGCLVLEAAGPSEALALLGQHAGTVAAVVSALAMDGNPSAGLEQLAEVARHWPACVRILVSG